MGKKISPEKKALDALREGITQLVTCRSQLMETKVARVELVTAQIRSVLYELMITDRFLKKLVKKKELEDEQNADQVLPRQREARGGASADVPRTAGGTLLGVLRVVRVMSWQYWTVLGIAVLFVALFFISCAVLNYLIDRDDEDDNEGWR